MTIIKTIHLLSLTLLTTLLLSACNIEIDIPASTALQNYTISGSANHHNNNLTKIKVDNILELEINGIFVERFISNNNLKIPAFSFKAYPGDTITIRGKNTQTFTGCSIGKIYLSSKNHTYKLSQEREDSICFDGEVFYEEIFELPYD